MEAGTQQARAPGIEVFAEYRGYDRADYVPGVATAFTGYTDVVVGAGDTMHEALEDAMEGLSQVDLSGIDLDSLDTAWATLEKLLEGLDDTPEDFHWEDEEEDEEDSPVDPPVHWYAIFWRTPAVAQEG